MTDDDTQAITARLPKSLYQQLRSLAYESHRPMNQIVIDAISAAIKRELGNENR